MMGRMALGQTGLMVSDICLGTMTWGTQNSEDEAHEQIAYALEQEINFWDTAEMYPVNPVSAETVGGTERIIGNWFGKQGGRDRVVLATKVTGQGMNFVRGGAEITGASLRGALEGSLRRLQTDYVDLYQLHWPNRGSYHFRKVWNYAPKADKGAVRAQMEDVLRTAADLVAEGKVRQFGLSNETVWGAGQWLRLAEDLGLPRMATVQNEYSLLCRQFDSDWAELAVQEEMPLLAFSPLACGLLSGKYAGGVIPTGSRRERSPDLSGRVTANMFQAVPAYLRIAAEHRLDPCQMAIAFCRQRPFPCIPIIGATTLAQLQVNIGAGELVLSAEVLAAIGDAHKAHPQPY